MSTHTHHTRLDRLQHECDVRAIPALLLLASVAALFLWLLLQAMPGESTAQRSEDPVVVLAAPAA